MSEGAFLGRTGAGEKLFLSYEQRRQHTYIIGVNGTGKTTLLREIAHSDMLQEPKHGLCVIDPHGDLIEDILALVPESRLDDVILIDPSDEENPFCLNVFAPVPEPEEIGRVASEIVAIFRKIFGGAWTPEIEGVLQNVTLTLLSRPANFELQKGQKWVAAMDEIPALLAMERVEEADRANPPWKRRVQTYRSQFYRLLQERDQIPVWEFWNYNFDTLTPRPRSELSFAVLNQVRRFLANPTVRNIVAQTESKLDLSQVMNDGRILLVNLSKGLLGEANSAFLGSVLVAKLVVAVFARAKLRPPAKRRPFHIIVDEFQNFAISSFPMLLSEARKYNVDLVIAHQYRDQLRDWVQGATVNAGNIVCFRVGGDDALDMAREFDATPPEARPEMEPIYQPLGVDTKTWADVTNRLTALERFDRALSAWQARPHEAWAEGALKPEDLMAYWWWICSIGEPTPKMQEAGDILPPLDRYEEIVESLATGNPTDDLVAWRDQFISSWAKVELAALAHDPAAISRDVALEFLSKNPPCQFLVQAVRESLDNLRREVERLSQGESRFVQTPDEERKGKREVTFHGSEGSLYWDIVDDHVRGRTVYRQAGGRPRLYSDVYQQMANQLAHLPNFHARCRLSGSDAAPLESTFRTRDWPEVASNAADRAARFEQNKGRAKENTHRDFTRPRKEVQGEFRARYETMLRSIGMSWSPDEPLPTPQVLLESED